MFAWRKRFETWSKPSLTAISVAIVALVGWADYLTGYELFFFIFYLFAVFLAVWYASASCGVLISALSVTAWISSNIAAGESYSDFFVPIWNAIIMFVFYLVVVGLLAKLRSLHQGLEERVRLRTTELTGEMQVRMRLQNELLEISEREQQRLGHDLHDGLCQHLTGTALASHVLGQKLADRSLPEMVEANRLVVLIEEAIDMTRKLSRGLHPLEARAGSLADGFRELAANASERFKVSCSFEGGPIGPLAASNVATHLYRIAQEAIANAVRHGKAGNVNISLDDAGGGLVLNITDDGIGLPEAARNGDGMGLRIMAYRAETIGATFNIERLPTRGTRITCTLPAEGGPSTNHVKKN